MPIFITKLFLWAALLSFRKSQNFASSNRGGTGMNMVGQSGLRDGHKTCLLHSVTYKSGNM